MSLATQVASLPHPPSAMNFNGVYLEDKISGYYTESVEGRYNSSIEITDRSITGVDGSEFIRKRYETRSLDVKYSIYADTKIELHQKESQVKQYTREAEAKIIFDDEPQYYWIGTVSEIKSEGIDATGSGIWVSTGVITISLNDPYKYSTVTKEFKASPAPNGALELTIKNEGTAPVPIDYKIVHGKNNDTAENGYVGIVSENGIIQLGNIQESDGQNYEQSELVLPWTTVLNAPNTSPAIYYHNDYDTGDPNDISIYSANSQLYDYAYASSGPVLLSNTVNPKDGRWHGGFRVVPLNPDSNGHVGATNFYAWFDHWFETGLMGQTGSQRISFLTSDNREICSVRLIKWDESGNEAHCQWFVNNVCRNDIKFTPAYWDSYNPNNMFHGYDDCLKQGSSVRFFWWGGYYTYTDPAIANMECTKVQFYFSVSCPSYRDVMQVTRNYLRDFRLTKYNVQKWRDVQNRYGANCFITIDGKHSKVYVNGLPKQSEENVGSTYFLAPPGETKVQFYFSSFCTDKPTCTATIREKYL